MKNAWLLLYLLTYIHAQNVNTTLEETNRDGKQLFKLHNGRIVLNLPESNVVRNDDHRSCTTPNGKPGFCLDLSDCPNLIFDLTILRKSVCFKQLFVPGICCPKFQEDEETTTKITTTSTATIPSTTTKIPTTKKPKRKVKPNKIAKPNRTTKPIETTTSSTTTTKVTTTPKISTTKNATLPSIITTTSKPWKPHHFDCGHPVIPKYRIVGGVESQRGQWPWMTAIFLHGPKGSEYWCGGSLISKRYVLTAAHCTKDASDKTFHPLQFSVRVGDHNIFSKSDDHLSKPKDYRVQSIKTHPEFRRNGFYNDIALLKLETEVEYSEYVLPVCLPTPALAGRHVDSLAGASPTVIGYGAKVYNGKHSEELREATLPIWRNSDCDEQYFQPISDIFLCAGYYSGGHDACQGDSGGPLQLYKDNRWIQIGIVSFGNKCADPGYPGVYTRITKFLSWIYHNMQ